MPSADDAWLLRLARVSVRFQLRRRRPLYVAPWRLPGALKAQGACFVSLHIGSRLRGCIGSMEPRRPLAVDVAANAAAAAFADPRFSPLTRAEFDRVEFEISLLEPLQPFPYGDVDDLVAQLRPGRDGLLLECEGRRGVFLPVVWETLPDPGEFVGRLKAKAGIPADHRLGGGRAWRFTTRLIRDD